MLCTTDHVAYADNVARLSCKNVSSDPNVFLSRPASWSVTGDHFFHVHHHVADPAILPTMSFSAFDQIDDHDTIFPMHEHCLQIARRAIDSVVSTVDVGQDTSSFTVLNKVLQSRYRDRAGRSKADDLITRKDLLNLCTSTSTEGPRGVIGLSLLEWWAGDYEVIVSLLITSQTHMNAEILHRPDKCT
jgi:hypothetical protein